MVFRLIALATGFALMVGCPGGDAEAPTLTLDVGSEATYTANEDNVRIELRASDPQDQRLTFSLVEGPAEADFYTFRDSAVFNWTPHAGDITGGDPHHVVFGVTNESGVTTERTVRIHIVSTGGAYFVNSASQLYDPSRGEPLQFDVEVKHDEVPEVELSMPPEHAPEQAHFEQRGDFHGQFEWMPTPGQREHRTHSVVFEADDGTRVYDQEVTIIFQNVDSGGVPGAGGDGELCEEAPQIDHEPIAVGVGASDYDIEATLPDPAAGWNAAVVNWTFDDPLEEETDWKSMEMEIQGDRISGQIPNPLLARNQSVEISYSICVFDETSTSGDVACAPDEYFYRFVAYSPDEERCLDDPGIGNPDRASEISTAFWESFRGCDGSPNYHRLNVESAQSADVAISYSAGRSPDIEARLAGEPVEVYDIPCVGLSYVLVDEAGMLEVEISEDHFPYHITAFVDEPDGEQCPIEHATPDEAVDVGDEPFFLEDQQICNGTDRDLYAIEALKGDVLDAFYQYDTTAGELRMALVAPSQEDEIVDGNAGVIEANPVDGEGYFVNEAMESGTYYVMVYPRDDEGGEYNISTWRNCVEDEQFVDNDTFETAADVSLGTYEELKLCADSSDWYSYTRDGSTDASIGGHVHVYQGDGADVELSVYNQEGEELTGSDTQGESTTYFKESIVQVEPGETIHFEVSAESAVLYEFELFEDS